VAAVSVGGPRGSGGGPGGGSVGGPAVLAIVAPALREALFDAESEALLHGAGSVLFAETLEEGLRRAPEGVAVLITSWGMPLLTAPLLDRLPHLRLVAHIGASVKPFATPELFARGVRITQAGAAMAPPVAEVSLAFTLALLHRLPRFDHALHAGAEWADAETQSPRHELAGSVVGVVGASRTGRAYIAMVRALGARVLLSDPTIDAAEAAALGATLVPLDDLLAGSRILALHAPSLPGTLRMIGARELALLPDGAGLVNTARSWLVDEGALVAELASGRIDAALDVFDEEPLPVGHPLRGLPNVLLVPHQAAGTVEGRRRQGALVASEVAAFRAGRPLAHEVHERDLETMA
jgi:phosphoglycerate dehydrogenase-like enzyme